MLHKPVKFVVIITLLALGAVSALAQPPTSTLSALAQYASAQDAMLFAAVRTDDAFIDELDTALAPLYPYMNDFGAGFSLRGALDAELADSDLAAAFDDTSDLFSLVGDTAAIVVLPDPAASATDDIFEDGIGYVVLNVLDRARLENLLTTQAGITPTTDGDYLVYALEDDDEGVVALSDDLLIVGERAAVRAATLGDFAPLSTDARFTQSLGALPNDSYNALLYFNAPAIERAIDALPSDAVAADEDLQGLKNYFSRGSSITLGFTILEGRAFTVDLYALAQPNALADLALQPIGTINSAFAANIPQGLPLVIHSTNLSSVYDNFLSLLFFGVTIDDDPESTPEQLESGLALVNTFVRGATGLTLDEIFGWMTQDYALFLGTTPAVANADSIFDLLAENPLQLGFIADASANREQALALVDGIEMLLSGELAESALADSNASVSYTREGDTLTLTITDTSRELPFPIVLQVGVQDDLFFFASPNTLNALGSANLNTDPTYANAGAWLLPQSDVTYYVDFDNLTPLISALRTIEDDPDLATTQEVFNLFESAVISGSTFEDALTLRALIALK